MTLADVAQPPVDPSPASPSWHRGLVWIAGIVLLAATGAVVSGTYYYDSVTIIDHAVPAPVVQVTDLPLPVTNAFVAAVDPDFYDSGDGMVLTPSPITRRYMVIASGARADEESSWRIRVMADKAEAEYAQPEILHRYLNSADYGRDAVGLATAAQTYFGKPAKQLTVAEAALLAAQLHPDRPTSRAGWGQVLDTMVERGWLSSAERNRLTYPG
jgi:membrane peptidoglycan carboxypeptidase